MEFIIYNFDKLEDETNMKIVERMLRNLRFFKNFDVEMRKHILMNAKLVRYKKDDYIFKIYEPASTMYVIIQGQVNLKKSISKSSQFEIIIGSLYDGDHFGEESLVVDPKILPIQSRLDHDFDESLLSDDEESIDDGEKDELLSEVVTSKEKDDESSSESSKSVSSQFDLNASDEVDKLHPFSITRYFCYFIFNIDGTMRFDQMTLICLRLAIA